MIEQIRKRPVKSAKAVVFDFDGTIGTIRAGWMPLMLDMMMETLGLLGPDPEVLHGEAAGYIARLTGSDTVEQMNAFADHVRRLGGTPKTGFEYKLEFLGRLEQLRGTRLEALRQSQISPDELMIPGARAFLDSLGQRDIPLYLASGSEHFDILLECGLLGIDHYFKGIYGSAVGVPNKKELLNILLAQGIDPDAIVTFGDGRTEIELTHAIGGRTIGVASDEPECLVVDPKKRRWLIAAGADYIIPNYLEPGLLSTVTAVP